MRGNRICMQNDNERLQIVDFDESFIPAAVELWTAVPGMGLGPSDGPEALAALVRRNPGLCAAALAGGALAGTALAGYDGRRATLYHVCVAEAWRGRGLAKAMLSRCLEGLRAAGCAKASLYCLRDNPAGMAFWEAMGWRRRDDLALYSLEVADSEIG